MIAAYNFNKCWRAKLARWKKRMTIREDRKDGRVPKIGDLFRGYVGMRTKNCELVVQGVVSRVATVMIYRADNVPGCIVVGGSRLVGDDLQILATKDGFASVQEFFDWFIPAGKKDVFRGVLIEWKKGAE